MSESVAKRLPETAVRAVLTLALAVMLAVLAGCTAHIPETPFERQVFGDWKVSCERGDRYAACDIKQWFRDKAGEEINLEVSVFSTWKGISHGFDFKIANHYSDWVGGLTKQAAVAFNPLLWFKTPFKDSFLRVDDGGTVVPVDSARAAKAKEAAAVEMLTGRRVHIWGIDKKGKRHEAQMPLDGYAQAHAAAMAWLTP